MRPHEKIEILIDRALEPNRRAALNSWSIKFLTDIRGVLGKARYPETALSMKQKAKVYAILKEAKIPTHID